jgi:hypothetical protein
VGAHSHDGPRLKRLGLLALAGAARTHAMVTARTGATVAWPACACQWLRCGVSTVEGRRTHRATRGGGSPMGSVDGEAEGYNGAAECTDGEGPAMAGDNPMVLLQLHASEGV